MHDAPTLPSPPNTKPSSSSPSSSSPPMSSPSYPRTSQMNGVQLNGPAPLRNPPTVASLARGGPTAARMPPSLAAKLAAMANRGSQQQVPNGSSSNSPPPPAPPSLLRTFNSAPSPQNGQSRPPLTLGGRGGLGAKRKPNLNIRDILGPDGIAGADGLSNAGLGFGVPQSADDVPTRRSNMLSSPFENFEKIVDPSGALKFGGKAVLHASGVDFSNGSSFAINMTQMQLLEELGRGNYGTVKKVLHKPTNVLMAMKEIRLELDDSKLSAILMELDILHRAVAREIVEFYGAFFIESCVYYCMEFMDAGSLDKLQGAGVPEFVLARITQSMVRGLKFLKDELQIMHRDVKPTNVLVNRKGEVKLCDFGVSGQLEKSLAKTNIGCQSYMAPERIRGESQGKVSTYTISSDVWSLGLSVVEISLGRYPYPPETYENVFAQLSAIVDGPAPELPPDFSEASQDFVARCLVKQPERRATYAELLDHPFLVEDRSRDVDMVGWVQNALSYREAQLQGGGSSTPAPPGGSSEASS